MNSRKWFITEWPLSLKKLSADMLKNQYNNKLTSGFVLEKVAVKNITGKFITKRIIKENIEDPFGSITEVSRISYDVIKFTINKDKLGLSIIDPPRSIKNFINILHEISGIGLSVSEVTIDPLIWLHSIENSIGKQDVTKIMASDINIHNKGLAKIEVVGKNDIRKEFTKFIQDKYHKVSSVKFNDNKMKSGSIILRCNGSIKIEGAIPDEIIDTISTSLMTLNS